MHTSPEERASLLSDRVLAADATTASNAPGNTDDSEWAAEPPLHDPRIGELLRAVRSLSASQIDSILAYQREKRLPFGQAAVELDLASADDVLWALSQQFHYPYARENRDALSTELPVAREPFSAHAEVFRRIRSQLLSRLQMLDRRAALAVVSPQHGDGKSYFAANLAVAFGQLGSKTLLIDADLRHPRQHQIFGIDVKAGLSSVLSGRSGEILHTVPALPGLSLLPVGALPPNPLELVERPAFALLLKELTAKFDHVVVDTPAADSGADAAVIAARCGAAVVLARGGKSPVSALDALVSRMRGNSTEVLGALINEH